MAKIQQNLKESLEKQSSMNSLERLSKTLGTTTSVGVNPDAVSANPMELDSNNSDDKKSSAVGAVDACDSLTPTVPVVVDVSELRGENKAVLPVAGKKWKRRKHGLASAQKKKEQKASAAAVASADAAKKERPKPRYFCQF